MKRYFGVNKRTFFRNCVITQYGVIYSHVFSWCLARPNCVGNTHKRGKEKQLRFIVVGKPVIPTFFLSLTRVQWPHDTNHPVWRTLSRHPHDHFFRLNKVSLSLFHVECPTRRLGRPEMVRVPFLHTWYRSPSRRSDLQLSKHQSIFSENNCFPSFLVFFLISGDCGGLPEEVICRDNGNPTYGINRR